MRAKKEIQLLSDNELIEQIVKKKSTDLFAELYDRYADQVYNRCLNFASPKEEAQDLTHDIFLKLFVKLRTFRGEAKFSTWLSAVTYNFCMNYIKRDKRKLYSNLNDVGVNRNIDTSEAYLFELNTELLKEALSKIDPSDRMILILKYQEEMRIGDIVDIMEITESAVKMKLKRAREKVIIAYQKLR